MVAGTQSKESVLLVDDEPQVLVALEDLLGEEFSVFKAASAEDAMALLKNNPEVAVIITDQRMPKMNGDQLLTSLPSTSKAIRILITGYADLSAVVRAVNEGKIFAYITKPWSPEDLHDKVHKAAQYFRLQRQLAVERQRLREQTRILNSILDCMGEGVIVADHSNNFLMFNRQAERILGVGPNDTTPMDWTRTCGVYLPDRKTPIMPQASPLFRVMSGEEFVEMDLFVRNRNVEGAAIALTATPLKGEGGRCAGGIAVIRDVTQQRRLEAQLLHGQKMEAIGQLAGGVAHDFNNLLAVIISYGELLLEDLNQDDPKADDLGQMLAAAQRGATLTRQLLAFSRRETIEPKVLQLNDIVSGVEKMLRRIIGEHIKLRPRLAPNVGLLRADAGQLEQVILNLTVNARDAMPEGGELRIETRDVHVAAGEEPNGLSGDCVLLEVTDTGSGMDSETRQRIFEPFFTTKETGKGTGLGLSTVYGIVQQSGGRIQVDSEIGRGTSFRIYFPRVKGRARSMAPPRFASEIEQATETILIVEDDEAVRTVAARILRANGYSVLEALGPSEARSICEKRGPEIDLLLTDVVMPGINGPKLAEELSKVCPQLRVLYMSGYSGNVAPLPTARGGTAPCVEKPFSPESLSAKVREVLKADS